MCLLPLQLSCFAAPISQTTCSDTDYSCQCQPANQNTIKASVTGCLTKSPCIISDLQSKLKQNLESWTARRLLQLPEIQTWSNTFCPNVLASSSQSTTPDATSSPSSNSQAAPSTNMSSSSTSSLGGLSTATAAGGSASAFGANTPGTTWGPSGKKRDR